MKHDRKRDKDEDAPAKPAQPTAAAAAAGAAAQGQPIAAQPGAVAPAPANAKPAGSQEMPAGGADGITILPLDATATLDLRTRREHTIARLKKIGLAMGDYVRQKNQYPAPAVYNRDKYPLLSWRVSLLPYLGHADLHQMFHLNEPWNSEHNKKLLTRIPPVFQSPDRSDEKTNYLLMSGPATMFSGPEGSKPADISDGLANTVMLVEVDDAKAVPWTQPIDFVHNPEQDPRLGLNALRDDGFFVVWANASIGRISPDAPAHIVRATFTRSGKEPFTAGSISLPAIPEVDPEYANRVKAPPTRPATSLEPVVPPVGPVGPVGVGTTSPSSAVGADVKARLPIPNAEDQAKSEALFREIFRQDFEAAKTPKQKYEFAKRLIEHVKKVKDDPSGRYVMLTKGSRIATDVGELTTALSIDDQLIAAFEVDAHQVKVDTIFRASDYRGPMAKVDNDKLILVSEELVAKAMFNDDYPQAQKLIDIAIEAARRAKERLKTDDLAQRKKEITHARSEYRKVEKVVDSLKDDPEDANSNLIVGWDPLESTCRHASLSIL